MEPIKLFDQIKRTKKFFSFFFYYGDKITEKANASGYNKVKGKILKLKKEV